MTSTPSPFFLLSPPPPPATTTASSSLTPPPNPTATGTPTGSRLSSTFSSNKPNVTDPDALASALQQCSAALSPRGGTQIHARILRLGLTSSAYLSSQLLYYYSSCGDLDSARAVLDTTPPHHLNPFFYNVIIRAYAGSTRYEDAIDLFLEMLEVGGFPPNDFTFPFVLKSCSALGFLELGREIHALLVKTGLFDTNVFSGTALLDLYAKWGYLEDACNIFDRIPERNVVAWNSIISAYVQNGFVEQALGMLESMRELGLGVDVSSWNSVIAGCVRCGDVDSTLEILRIMLVSLDLVRPNAATFNTLLPVIPDIASFLRLKELHGFAIRNSKNIGMESKDDERFRSAVAAGYANIGCMAYASSLFERISLKTSQLWSSIISGFLYLGKTFEAFDVFRNMAKLYTQELRALPKISLTLLLPECGPLSKSGLEIHAYAYRHDLESSTSISNALISMYTKKGDIELAELVFERTTAKDVVTWNAMVWSHAFFLNYNHAFYLFNQMLSEGVRPDPYSFGSVLNGCGHTSSLRHGMMLHGFILKSGFSQSYLVVQNALMDMYGKCGCIEDSRKIFDDMESKDIVSWNTIISCCGFNASPHMALFLFNEMQRQGWKPNRVTFVGILSACSHAGLLYKGLHYFKAMTMEYGIMADVEHYTCIVDNLGRAGQLDRAYSLIKNMPVKPDECIWSSLLSSCRIHGNVELAEVSAKHLIELQPRHSGYTVLLSNIYADACRWQDVSRVWAAMKDNGIRKSPGYSWIEVGGGELVRFFTADKSHEQSLDIYLTLNAMTEQLRDEGYLPLVDSNSFLDQP